MYGCILAILMLVLIFGLRARRNVKKEKITSLPDGFSPLDVKRIFIGRTYARRLTRALIVHWANRGLITVKYVSKYKVRIHKVKSMPKHDNEKAVFFDRGTYVREYDFFHAACKKFNSGPIDLRQPLFSKEKETNIRKKYATREDEGVYSAKHFTLKLITILLSLIPSVLCVVWSAVYEGQFMSIAGVGTSLIGLFVLMFINDMPKLFKAVWCGGWLAGSVAFIMAGFSWSFDPLGIIYVATIVLFAGPLFLVRFVDYREKNNLADYSDLINYRKFFLWSSASDLSTVDYYEVLPMLYAFNIKRFVKHKFIKTAPPKWYKDDEALQGALI